MSRRSLWKASILTLPEAEEAVAELLERELGEPVSCYTDVDTGTTTVAVYLERKPNLYGATRRKLEAGLGRVRACGLNIGCGKVSLTRIRREDWAESWRRHFRPLEIGSRLLIRPSWSRRRPRRGQTEVVIDPGLSFGTGQHPTTAFCLQQLVARRRPGERQEFLDIGTGSGILAISAAKLGYSPVDAFDSDPEAIRIARANARKNGVSRRIRIFERDVTRLKRQDAGLYCLICANLTSTLLVAEQARILSQLKKGGVLALAGVMKSEFSDVRRAYESAGFRLAVTRVDGEWRSGSFDF